MKLEPPLPKINIACGKTKLSGYWNIDIAESVNPDGVLDMLQFPWLWDDNSVDEIFCSHFIEHIGDEFIAFMDEAHRVLKPGGLFRIRCPYYTSIRAVQDPTHKRFISEAMWQYFSAEGRKKLGVEHYPIKCDFDIEEMRFHFPEEMKDLENEERKYLLQHAWNTAADIEVVLKKHQDTVQ